MGKVKAWVMDMEEQVYQAMEEGAQDEDTVVAVVRQRMVNIDEAFIRRVYRGEGL